MNQYKTSEQQRAAARLYYHTNIKNNPHKMLLRRDYNKLYYQNKNKKFTRPGRPHNIRCEEPIPFAQRYSDNIVITLN